MRELKFQPEVQIVIKLFTQHSSLYHNKMSLSYANNYEQTFVRHVQQ